MAVTRRDPEGPSGVAWIPEEVVPLPAIVDAYTRNGAYAVRLEDVTGTLEMGKAADLVVLDRNIFTVPPQEIHRARVWLTLLEGRTVFADSLLR